jgi:hypothetical protein
VIVVVPAPTIVTFVPFSTATFVLLLVQVSGLPELFVSLSGIDETLP